MAGQGAYLAWLACVSCFWCDSPRLLDSLWPWCMMLAGFETQYVTHKIYTAVGLPVRSHNQCVN